MEGAGGAGPLCAGRPKMHGQRILPRACGRVAAAPPVKHLGRKTRVYPSSSSIRMPAAASVLLSQHHVDSLHDVVLCWVIPRQRGANQASRTMESVWRKQHSRLIFARDLQNGGNCFSVVVQQMSDVLSNLQTTSGVTPATFLDPCGPRKTHVLVYHNDSDIASLLCVTLECGLDLGDLRVWQIVDSASAVRNSQQAHDSGGSLWTHLLSRLCSCTPQQFAARGRRAGIRL